MTHFFATPSQTQTWLEAEVERLELTVHENSEGLGPGGRRCFVWPRGVPRPPQTFGVVVDFPRAYGSMLTMGVTGWSAATFDESAASRGRRLNQQLTRSLRRMATVPLYAVSYDGTSRSVRPAAWGTPLAVSEADVLRQWRDGSVTYTAVG